MELRILFIAIVALYGVLIGILIAAYHCHRNIFTQRILSLNNELKRIEDLADWAPSKLPKLRLRVEYEGEYPPPIISRNLQNLTYKSVVDQFHELVLRRDRRIRRLTVAFAVLFAITGLVSLAT